MVFEGKFIIASGPLIFKDNKILVSKDNKDPFYKLIGGTIDIDSKESLEDACKRKAKEACGAELKIIKPLSPNILYENPKTKEKMVIILINYLAEILNPDEIKPIPPEQDLKWVSLDDVKQGKGDLSPNTLMLLKKEGYFD